MIRFPFQSLRHDKEVPHQRKSLRARGKREGVLVPSDKPRNIEIQDYDKREPGKDINHGRRVLRETERPHRPKNCVRVLYIP